MKSGTGYRLMGKERRSREGAWIEISLQKTDCKTRKVAPARERGLKYHCAMPLQARQGRSREGAWIEIIQRGVNVMGALSRSREGAWIEIVREPQAV